MTCNDMHRQIEARGMYCTGGGSRLEAGSQGKSSCPLSVNGGRVGCGRGCAAPSEPSRKDPCRALAASWAKSCFVNQAFSKTTKHFQESRCRSQEAMHATQRGVRMARWQTCHFVQN